MAAKPAHPPPPPLRIGPIEVCRPAVLAALAGYTDLTYRHICRRLGAGYCATEVMLDTSINLSEKLRRRLVQTHPDDHPLAGQIMGCRAETMAEAAAHLVAMGCDVVDLNFACPVPKVLRRRRGGHMMRDPETALAVCRAVTEAVDVPVTLKLRRGFQESGADGAAFWRIAEGAFDLGLAAICVHARSVEARYAGPADWEFLTAVKRHFADKTVIGSGDALTAEAGVQMLGRTGVDGVAFARGALGNPWIFRHFNQLLVGRTPAAPTLLEQQAVLQDHYAMCVEQFGVARGPRMMRRFGIRYARCHPMPKIVRHAFIVADGDSDIRRIIETYYG